MKQGFWSLNLSFCLYDGSCTVEKQIRTLMPTARLAAATAQAIKVRFRREGKKCTIMHTGTSLDVDFCLFSHSLGICWCTATLHLHWATSSSFPMICLACLPACLSLSLVQGPPASPIIIIGDRQSKMYWETVGEREALRNALVERANARWTLAKQKKVITT